MLVHEEPSTPGNDDEYLRLITDKHAVEKRLEYSTSQLLAEEERRKQGGRKAGQAKGRGLAGRGGNKSKATEAPCGKNIHIAKNVQIESDEESNK